MILGQFKTPFCKSHQLHYLIKWQHAGQTLHRTHSLHIYVGGQIYFDSYMKKPGRSDLKRSDLREQGNFQAMLRFYIQLGEL